MDWTNIIKTEYEALTIQKEKEKFQFWIINYRSSVDSQTKKTRVCKWNSYSDERIMCFDGDNEQINVTMLPKATPPPSMTMWVPIPHNFVSEDCKELKYIPYLGDDMLDDVFIEHLTTTYDCNFLDTKSESLDDEMFVSLVQKLIGHQKNLTTSYSIVQKDNEEELLDATIFQINCYFDGNYTAEM